jgi:phosphoserine phosphatase RsbU/P
MFKLSLNQDEGVLERTLGASELLIGRLEDCDIHLDSSRVSRRHARLFMVEEAYWIEDLKSSNGTLINNGLIESAVQLRDGDQISVGGMELHFHQIGNLGDTDTTEDKTVMSSRIVTIASQDSQGATDNKPEEKLRAVLSISRRLAESSDLDGRLPIIIDSLFEIFPRADRGSVLLRDPGSGQVKLHISRDRRSGRTSEPHVSATVLDRVFSEKVGILSADASSDSRFDLSKSIINFNIRSVMCAPLLDLNGQAIGAITLDAKEASGCFSDEDLELLTTVAGQAALSYENARLIVRQMEQERQQFDLEMARRVQLAILPPRMPQLTEHVVFASYEAAAAVGGDYYDCFPTGDGKLCIALGDVAGKGVSASLLMSRLSSVMHSSMRFVKHPVEAFSYINRHMCRGSVEGRFVTLVVAIVDLESHEVVILNAGHMVPIVRSASGAITASDEKRVGIPLGIMDDYPYEMQPLILDPGDSIVLYSDGISEARNEQGELYGLDRLLSIVSGEHVDAQHLGEAILLDVHRHVGREPQSDDISLLCFGRKPA